LPPGLQCYKWPDGSITQTFDPQSPPCISRWDDSKGNGGATAPGVTGTTINVALPVSSATASWPGLKPIVDFFNAHFQFYGRKINIVPVPSQQADNITTGKWNNPQFQRADAAQIAAAKVFATTDFVDPIPESATLPVFLDAMVKHKIIALNGGDVTPYTSKQAMISGAPYLWSYYPTVDELMRNVATMTCRQMAGGKAIHSPDPKLKNTPRKYVIWLPADTLLGGPLPGLSTMQSILKGCGIDAPVVHQPTGRLYSTEMVGAMSRLKNDGVTTVIFYPYGGNGTPGAPLTTARQIGYRPEWDVIGWENYNTAYMLNDPPAETAGAFGIGAWNKQPLQAALEPWAQAGMSAGGIDTTLPDARAFYQEMMLLASGIQMAGPDLTPETFADALHKTTFPNPGAGGPPFYQASVGFPGDDPFMVSDYTAFWLDNRYPGSSVGKSVGANEGNAFCEAGRGRRWSEGTWPTQDIFYEPGICR
ncbi:MAG TPA: hypothetical protein VHD81_01240, partial [Mycobacteriales bacterium]|nr:hypothetical protein [Mycobacteriales bacterium]